MNNAYLKKLSIILFVLFIFCCNIGYSKPVDYIALNTAPVTLSPEELSEGQNSKPAITTTAVEIKPIKLENNSNNSPSKYLNSTKSTTSKNIKNIVSNVPTVKQPPLKKNSVQTIKSLEVLDFDATDNTLKTKDSESFLLVPIDKEQLELENHQYQMDDLSTSLIKDAPKSLNTKTKIASRIYAQFNEKSGKKYTVKTKKEIVTSILIDIAVLALIIIFGILGYFFYKKRRAFLAEMERLKNLTYEEIKRDELIKAIEEFEQTEEKHKKLGQKIYINEIEKYKSLDGFKKDEVADEIINTMETIEKAQKNDAPLTLKNKSTNGFKKNNYAFENDIGTLSDEEGIALFDEGDDNNFSSEEEFLNPDYYSENTEIFNDTDNLKDDIFIIEDEEENQEREYKIVEEKPHQKQNVEPKETKQDSEKTENIQKDVEKQVENEQNKKVVKKIKKPEEPKLEIKERYPLDDNRGLALLSYKQTVALIGYIGDKITVLKRFSKDDKAENLSVRIYEELSDINVQYLVRAGKFKGIVEINADSIKLVLNL